jgi:hypothetical protein
MFVNPLKWEYDYTGELVGRDLLFKWYPIAQVILLIPITKAPFIIPCKKSPQNTKGQLVLPSVDFRMLSFVSTIAKFTHIDVIGQSYYKM